MIWANLLHLSFNMWEEADAGVPPEVDERRRWILNVRRARPHLRFDKKLWDELLRRMGVAGMNMVVLDVGDGIRFESHPEIAVRNAWTHARVRRELDKMRRMGLEPIPKLNFSASHDAWLGKYSRMLSTDTYYAVCRDLIAEVIALFGKPRFFHLGMDEETPGHQQFQKYVVVRQRELWWHDVLFYVAQVEKGGTRPWVWSDYLWRHPDEFFRKMPKSVLQSNWYYGEKFGKNINYVKAYLDLESHGYDQVPTGSNWSTPLNFGRTVAYCRRHIAPKRLLGFLQTPWLPTLAAHRKRHLEAIEVVGKVRK